MPPVLAESFSVPDSNFLAAVRTPALATVKVFVDAVLFQKLVPLTGMTGEHLLFQFKRR